MLVICMMGGLIAMYYTEEQIEEVRSKSDIVQIIGRYVNLKRTGSSYVGLCPFPVSYTHLDVYKRQTYFSLLCDNKRWKLLSAAYCKGD